MAHGSKTTIAAASYPARARAMELSLAAAALMTLTATRASAQWLLPAPAPTPAPAAAPAPTPAPAPAATPGVVANFDTAKGAAPDLGDTGTFVIDQISGFRGRVGGGVSYYGPLGVAYNTFSAPSAPQISFAGGVPAITTTESTINSWSIWLAPSLDYFLVKNLSIGGLFSIDTAFGTAESKVTTTTAGAGGGVNKGSTDLPTVTSFTLMPRAGYFLRINDRLSFWPRVGVGYFSGTNVNVQTGTDATSKQITTSTVSTNIHSLLFQFDIGLVYQITDNVFFRAAPSISFSTGGGGSVTYKNAAPGVPDTSGSGSAFQFELTSGFGANFSL